MKVTLLIFINIFLSFNLFAIDLNEKSSALEILSSSFIYIDKTNSFTKKEVIEREFIQAKADNLGFGIVPNTAVWIKFTLKNITDKPINKVLEYNNPETEDLYFFDGEEIVKDGMFHHRKDRESINPNFEIKLKPYEEKIFYIKAHCKISTLIVQLIIWNETDFIKNDFQHKTYIFLFFTVIATLLIYNLMIFIFARQLAYLYYILYLCAVLFFESIYLGIAQLYFFSNSLSAFVTKGTIVYITILVIPMILFTREFLHTKRFKKMDRLIKVHLYVLPVVALLSFDNFLFDSNVMVIFIPLAFLLISTAVYSYIHGQKEALYYLIGWGFIIISLVLSVLKSLGGFDITLYFPYVNELAFSLEALLFSIALACKIKLLSEEKNIADAKLIEFQKEEYNRLEKLVDDRTKKLQDSLEEKNILYRELNHRIKNNTQMILSLIKLQLGNSSSKKVKDALTITKNRINSVANLYEVLYLKKNTNQFKTQVYFENIIKNINENLSQEINIEYKIDCNINEDDLIYCGIILNELATNTFKYANCKELIIYIYKEDEYIYMIVKDDGDGFQQDKVSSLGLTIIETLVEKQLHGEMDIRSKAGTMTTIKWRDHA